MIDSYELWNGTGWADRREVLAWGAGHEIYMRIKQYGAPRYHGWFVINDLDMVSSNDDICGLHILRPNHYSKKEGKEHLIFGRLRGELVHLAITPDEHTHGYVQRFQTSGLQLERTDLSDGPHPILAAHLMNGSVAFYSTTAEMAEVQPFGRLQIEPGTVTRNKYSKFLSSSLFAVGTGRRDDALAISSISSERLALEREISVDLLDLDTRVGHNPRTTVSAIAPLRVKDCSSPGNVFLAAWGDRAIRLHDLRSDRASEFTFKDPTDQNLIYCLHPFGNDSFVAGAAGDAVIKIFDLRTPKTYNYLDAKVSSVSRRNMSGPSSAGRMSTHANDSHIATGYPSKDLSLFLSYSPSQRTSLPRWRFSSYRGAIYSMSSPSPLSSTIYAGIADGVVRLDFASTDDLTGRHKKWYRENFDLDVERMEDTSAITNARSCMPERILELSGYERPENYDTTRTSKLRAQQPFSHIGNEDVENEDLTGWDRRWKPLAKPGAWRRQH
ncbi:hypothetical protein BBP40_010536 [Aspergillus hancockii]|nr:hypothetical protein BBP40_010536 [Aspergillus hancockii]